MYVHSGGERSNLVSLLKSQTLFHGTLASTDKFLCPPRDEIEHTPPDQTFI